MDNQDRQAIDGLFARLDEAERQAGPRDEAADAFIRERVARQPAAPYLMAQTIVVQDYALQDAQRRIEEFERRLAERPAGGGLLSGFFGGGRSASVPSVPRNAAPASAMPAAMQPGRSGGGFLAGAAQTAMGVAGGVLLGNAIAGMFSGGEANAAEAPAESAEDPAAVADESEGGGFFDGLFGGDEEI